MGHCIKLSASAGSGKTFCLTIEFLKIVLQKPEEFRNVLAVTFTNKAAMEMKNRFIEALYELSYKPNSSYAQAVGKYNQTNARKALHSILHLYDEFSISTMDHFFLKLLRLFSSELFVNPNFDIEQEKLLLDNYIMDRLFTDLMEEKPSVRQIIGFLIDQYFLDEMNPLRLKRTYLPDYLNLYMSEEFSEFGDSLPLNDFNKLKVLIKKFNKLYKASLKGYLKTKEDLESFLDQRKDVMKEKVGRTNSLYNELKNKVFPEIDARGWYELDEIFKKENKVEQVGSLSFVNVKDSDSDSDVIKRNLRKIIFKWYRAYFSQRWYAELIRGILKVFLVSYLNNLREEFKRENGTLFLFEFSHLVAHLLKKYSVPFIYEYLGTRLKYLFIDEFQDTSYLQYKNFLPLVEELVSRDGQVMVVGDIKQSIYRWRNGNFEIMRSFPNLPENVQFKKSLNEIDLSQQYPKSSHSFQTTLSEQTLDKNYRSARTIVDFNNSLYFKLADLYQKKFDQKVIACNTITVQEVFRDVKQDPQASISDEGRIHLIFYTPPKKQTSGDGVEDSALSESEDREWLSKTKKEIEQILSEYNCMPGDIAVLLRTNAEIYELSQYLTREGIPVESPGLFKLSASPHVRLAMAALGYLAQPGDSLIQAEIQLNLAKITSTHNNLHNFLNSLQQIEQYSSLLPIDLLEKILNIDLEGFNLAQKGGDFITFLREEMYRLQLKGVNSLKVIWQWWQDKGREVLIPASPSRNNVQIMTIHASKGLEFPFVILPKFPLSNRIGPLQTWIKWKVEDVEFISHNRIFKPYLFSNSYPLWMKNLRLISEKEDILRDIDWLTLTYVATTRAKFGLSIFVEKKAKYNNIFKNKLSPDKLSGVDMMLVWVLNEYVKSLTGDGVKEGTQFDEYFFGNSQLSVSFEKFEAQKDPKSPFACNFTHDLNLFVKKSRTTRDFQSVQFGKWIHKLLQNIYTYEDLDQIIQAFSAEGFLDAHVVKKIKEILQEKKELFSPSPDALILNERPIARERNIYRPDRIIIKQNNACIFDYKTGEPEMDHESQIKMYSNLLKKIFNQVNHKLIYISLRNL